MFAEKRITFGQGSSGGTVKKLYDDGAVRIERTGYHGAVRVEFYRDRACFLSVEWRNGAERYADVVELADRLQEEQEGYSEAVEELLGLAYKCLGPEHLCYLVTRAYQAGADHGWDEHQRRSEALQTCGRGQYSAVLRREFGDESD